MTFEVIRPGLLTTLQDAGRLGLAHLGIGRAGAFDAPALRIANALCGNPPGACALEVTLLGPTLRFHHDALVALTGAPMPFRIAGVDQPTWAPVSIRAGTTIEFGSARRGCRSYFAVGGGIDAPLVLRSRSVDLNGQLGPFKGRPLRAGDSLQLGAGADAARASMRRTWRLDPRPWFADHPPTLRLLPGTQLERLAGESRKALFTEDFIVQSDSNRAGLRLSGPALELREPFEMVSEGCVPGVLQLPPSGNPIAFGPECPVSGGYPRIGQVAAADMPRLAQARPGDALRFTPCTFADALHAIRKQERALTRLEMAIATRLGT